MIWMTSSLELTDPFYLTNFHNFEKASFIHMWVISSLKLSFWFSSMSFLDNLSYCWKIYHNNFINFYYWLMRAYFHISYSACLLFFSVMFFLLMQPLIKIFISNFNRILNISAGFWISMLNFKFHGISFKFLIKCMLVQYNIDRSFKCCINMVNIKKMLKWSDIVAVKFPAITSLEIVRENINQSFRIDGKDKL